MKKWIVRIGAAAAVLVVITVVVVFFSLNSIVKAGVETVGPKLTQVDIRLDQARISPLSGAGELQGLFVGNPEGFKSDAAIQVGRAHLNLKLGSVLGDVIEVESIDIEGPEITFEGSLKGSNIGKLLENVEEATGGGTAAEPAPKSERKFKVRDIRVTNARVRVSITALGGKTMTLPLPDLHLQEVGYDKNGISAARLTSEILRPLLASITTVVSESANQVGSTATEAGKGAAEQVDKATGKIKSLFNRE